LYTKKKQQQTQSDISFTIGTGRREAYHAEWIRFNRQFTLGALLDAPLLLEQQSGNKPKKIFSIR